MASPPPGEDFLGKCGFGEVRKVHHKVSDTVTNTVARKDISTEKRKTAEKRRATMCAVVHEFHMSRRCMKSPYVLFCIYVVRDDLVKDAICLFMPLGYMDLCKYAAERRLNSGSDLRLSDICKQCAYGVRDVHAAGIVHRDVKPSNFIVFIARDETKPPRVRLSDFGLSLYAADWKPRSGKRAGTPRYMAPELEDPAVDVTLPYATDVYSLGVSFYKLCTGELPTFARTGKTRELCMPVKDNDGVELTAEARAVCKVALEMMSHYPAARLSMKDVCSRLEKLDSTAPTYPPSTRSGDDPRLVSSTTQSQPTSLTVLNLHTLPSTRSRDDPRLVSSTTQSQPTSLTARTLYTLPPTLSDT